ncbi:MAG: hypothetical protein FJ147_07920 [Deltaproteobacteria bacterium]|nr:hypothetical protein [Deltaproteobacteria bacterium]
MSGLRFPLVFRSLMTLTVLFWSLTTGVRLVSAIPLVSPLAPGDHDLTVTHDGRERYYIVHIPPQAAANHPLPVVLVFHGGGGQAQSQK